MKIVVTGGRDHMLPSHVYKTLNTLYHISRGLIRIGCGDCPTGVDESVRLWCTENPEVAYVRYVANWAAQGKAAGPIRNTVMLTEFIPAFVLAFPGGRGTEDCVRRARSMNIPVLRVED